MSKQYLISHNKYNHSSLQIQATNCILVVGEERIRTKIDVYFYFNKNVASNYKKTILRI